MKNKKPLFVEEKQKPLIRMHKSRQEIQYLSYYYGDFLIDFGENFLNPRSVILFHKGQEMIICVGYIDGKPFNAKPMFNDAISIFIDRRSGGTIRINCGNYNVEHSVGRKSSVAEDEMLFREWIQFQIIAF